MVRTYALLTSTLPLIGSAAAVSSNYTSQLLSSGNIKLGEWQSAYDKASSFANDLTTSEKINLITGGTANNVTLNFKDGAATVLSYDWVTTWPYPLAMAMTWNRDSVHAQSEALATEMKAKGINIANAPTAQPLGRCPWGGRNGETYGPDSYLNGILFGRATKGFNDGGVVPGGKHFLLNEQETNRESQTTTGGGAPSSKKRSLSSISSTDSYSAVVDDKTLHETYLFPFYDAIKNGLGGVMCAMNRVDGVYSCENQKLLAGHLKSEMGFIGAVNPDVSGQKTAINSANAGLDYGSSSYWSNSTIQAALANGTLTEARLNDMVIRNLMGYFKLGQDSNYPSLAGASDYVDPRKNHSKMAREFAASSLVLLKNKNNALPLKSPKTMAVFGYNAGSAVMGPNTETSPYGSPDVFQGHMAQVGGSGQGSFVYLVTPQHALTNKAMDDSMMLRFQLNDTVVGDGSEMAMSSASSGTGATQTTSGYASDQEVCLVFLNAYSGEGSDRGELRNEDQDNLVNEVASNCNNTIVVVTTTGPRLLDQWVENENVTAVVYGGALGQESGNAMIDVLYGNVNPSGKLVHTIAKNESDYNVQISNATVINFTEGNYLDYKYFDKYNVTPRYEFGHGLSYTTFSYSKDVTVQKTDKSALQNKYATGVKAVGGREDLWDIVATVETQISNTGDVQGAEVVQLYVSFPEAADEPLRQLRGFEKVNLAPGATGNVKFQLRRRDLSVWDVDAQAWAITKGTYTFHVGASSRDLKATATMTI